MKAISNSLPDSFADRALDGAVRLFFYSFA